MKEVGQEVPDCRKEVFLTFIGDGVFGNEDTWIASAIGRAIAIITHHRISLNIHICHHGQIDQRLVRMIDTCYETCLKALQDSGEL